MKKMLFILIVISLSNCSLNTDSKFGTKDPIKKKIFNDELQKIMNKSDNIISMTYDEYKIFIVEYNKKSKYPDISK
tara:strand:+ start:274 stop:501 length:228 start_codon:yes stop_codon:yes gene_type:complete